MLEYTVRARIGSCAVPAALMASVIAAGFVRSALGDDKSPAAPPPKICIVLVGDSTVTDESGWGQGFKAGLKPEVTCVNEAAGGRSSKSYRAEGRWDKALKHNPNYIFIQFGHNDEPGKGPDRETDPKTTYAENMARYVDEARQAGATPILVTSIARRRFNKDGAVQPEPSLTAYVEAVRKVAAEKKVPLLDLQARTLELYARLGEKGCAEISPRDDGKVDTTHLNAKGSQVIGSLVLAEVRKAVPELAPYLK